MIAYHWAPTTYRASIQKHGLLVPKNHPRLTRATTCSDGHRNPHISLARNPYDGWRLSAGFLHDRGNLTHTSWDLWQVDLSEVRYRTLAPRSDELVSRHDIPRRHLTLVASHTGA